MLGRPSQYIARDNVDGAAQGDRRPCSRLHQIERDFRPRVAHAHHQHRLIDIRLAVFVASAVFDRAAIPLLPRPCRDVHQPIKARAEDDALGRVHPPLSRSGRPSPPFSAANRHHLLPKLGLNVHFPLVLVVIIHQHLAGNVLGKVGGERLEGQVGSGLYGVQVEPVVMVAPRIGHLLALFEEKKRPPRPP